MFFSLVAVTVGPGDRLPVAAHAAGHKPAYAWSDNGHGQLRYGDTTTDYTPTPMRLPRGVTARSVAAGHAYSLVVGSDGHIYAWGNNESGQLGNGDETVYSAFTTSVWTQLPHGIAARSVAAGDTHSLAVGGDGHAYAWGNNESGQLGDGSMTGSSTPVQVRLPRGVITISVAAGRDYSLAVGGDGHIYAWGSNTIGQLGDGSTTSSSTPVQVRLPRGAAAVSIAAGDDYSLALTSDGYVYAWGSNTISQLGNGNMVSSSTPVKAPLPRGVAARSVAARDGYGLAAGSDGHIYAWGDNASGRLGNSYKISSPAPVSVRLPRGVIAVSVAAGHDYSLAVGSDGHAYAWGSNFVGELGNGDNSATAGNGLVRVRLPRGVAARSISAYDYSLTVGSDGHAYAWGPNATGAMLPG